MKKKVIKKRTRKSVETLAARFERVSREALGFGQTQDAVAFAQVYINLKNLEMCV